jgi:hypothetical protein
MRGKNENVLRAKFYDLKQTNDKKPAKPLTDNYFYDIVRKFVKDNNWSSSFLSQYYCAPAPLFSPRVYVPMDDSFEAPKAFGVEKEVAAFYWLVHYKGRFRALKKGTFRFVGQGDNTLVVRLNKKNVLACMGRMGVLDSSANSNPPEFLGKACNPFPGWELEAGQWFNVNQGQTFDIEILTGDAGGGRFSAFLFYEEKGATYPRRPDGSAFVYPILEFDGSPMPEINKPNPLNPPFPAKSERAFEGMKPGM